MVEHSAAVCRGIALGMVSLLALSGCAGGDDSHDVEDGTIPAPQLEDTGEESDDGGTGEGDDAAEDTGDTDDGDDASADDQTEAQQQTPEWPAANTTTMELVDTISEPVISPKSVVANGHGLAIASNMMYQNTITVYDTTSRELVQELSDSISPAEFGVEGYPDTVEGAPVEAVWTPDGQHAYVSQYRLAGLGADAEDLCQAGDAIAPSAVYRYSVEAQDWDQFIEVGRVPKYVEMTPDGETLLVSNWCDHDLSVVDVDAAEETMRIPLNSQPRGIVVMDDNRTAFVTAMFAHEIYRVDLETGDSEVIAQTGQRPRHLVRDAAGENIYITVAGANQLLRMNPETGEITDSTATGAEPRSMAISADGTALYVVNYDEATVSKFDAETLEEIDRLSTGSLPIGVTYDVHTGTVWVSNYSGTISVYDDTVER
ncbi:beta-propeller fold lactonase family protein [Nesterenkonia sp.]|uniref:beta-propeller fold lactonase family protein n=1 Tax=Nesterenkonia sp. TaxID=704201 RepID=UPI00262E5AB9|nr:beta-propeller fold lactonase family protein [Nesterenkonia sp.]